jgi:hypothetical protein
MLRLPVVLLLAIGLAGCASPISVRPPTATEIDRVKQHQLAVVLFQLRASIDGKPVSPLNPGDSNNSFRIYLANLDELEAPKQIRPASPSEGAAAEGWHYLILSPGVYYLLVLPPGVEQNPPAVAYHARSARYGRLTQYKFEPARGGFWSPELMAFVLAGTPPADFRELQGFWFQVPENKQVVYLGSLSTECRNGRGLGGLIDSCNDYAFANDPESAKRAVASSLPGLTLDALPLVLYGKPRVGTRLQELGAMNVVARTPAMIAAAFTGAEMSPWGVIPGTGRTIAVYNLLAIGFESAARASAEKRAEDRVVEAQPCIDRLANAVGAIDYSSRFVTALGQAARERGTALDLNSPRQTAQTAKSESARYRLTMSLPILRLREADQPQYLALELGLELRLEAVDSRSVGYYSMLYYAPELPIQSPLAPRSSLYAQFVSQRAKPRPISEWCGANGAALLAEEVSAALTQIAAQVARDLD